MNWRSVFPLLFLIAACGKTPQSMEIYLIKHAHIDSDSKIPPVKTKTIIEEEIDLGPGYIPWNLFEKRDLKVPHPFDPYKTLFKLFPGKYCEADNGTTVSRWISPRTPSRLYYDWGMQCKPNDKYPFPKEDCQSIYLDTLGFTNQNGEQCILYSTSSLEFTGGVLNCGRFAGAYLGMALFVKHDNEWVLENFNPAVGCYGSWSTAEKPEGPGVHAQTEVFYAWSCQGGNGGFPSYGVHFIFAPVRGIYKEVAVIENSIRRYHDTDYATEWETEIKYENDTTDYPMIIAIKTGIMNGADRFLTDDWKLVPKGIKKYAKHHFKFKFRETKYYQFINDKYELMRTTYEVWDKEWKLLQ